jgi:hypothetical protein
MDRNVTTTSGEWCGPDNELGRATGAAWVMMSPFSWAWAWVSVLELFRRAFYLNANHVPKLRRDEKPSALSS